MIKKWLSYLFEIKEEAYKSDVSDYLEVSWVNGKKVLNCYHANYSFGSLSHVFDIAFQKVDIQHQNIQKVLILGYAVGSVGVLLREKYQFSGIIHGVELDEQMITIGKKHFPKGFTAANKIEIQDAFEFIHHVGENTYDLIIFDVFIDLWTDKKFDSKDFIQALYHAMANNGMLIYNQIASENVNIKDRKITRHFEKLFSKVDILNIQPYGNDIIVAKK